MANAWDVSSSKPTRRPFFFQSMGTALVMYWQTYKKFLLLGDFNAKSLEPSFSKFMEQ